MAVVLATVALALTAPGVLSAAGPALLVVAALAGLPHGALDVVALVRRAPGQPLAAALVRAVPGLLLYAAAAALALAVALAVPRVALVLLLALSVAHFAEGERAYDLLRGGRGHRLPAAAVSLAAVVLPLALHPGALGPLLGQLGAAALLSPGARGVLGAAALLLAGAAVLRATRQGDLRDALEVAAVIALFAVVPPLPAFAVWFAAWHSLRHTERMQVETGLPLALLARAAALPSLAAAAGLLVLAARLGSTPAVVLGLLALTVPHTVVVARLGRRC